MASPLSPGNSDTVSIAAGEGVTLDTAAGDLAVIEAVSGVVGSANREILVRHYGGRAFYGPFLPSGTVKISAVNGVVSYVVSTGFDYGDDTTPGTLGSLSDVAITAPEVGQVLKFDGTDWVNDDDATGGGGVTDGDKGDITVSADGETWTIDAGVVTLAKMANLAQDQFIVRTTASTGVPQTATVTAAARTVLDDTTVAAMMDTLGGGTVSNTEFQYLNGVTSAIQTQIDAKLDAAIATDITDTKTTPVAADDLILLDSAASDAPKLTTFGGLRTFMNNKVVGTALATTGTIDLDLAALTGTEQNITLTGNPTFTTSNRAAGRYLELRLDAGGSTRTLAWPAGWIAFGAALPTSLASGAVLRLAIFCRSTTDASVDATSVVSA